MLDENFIRSGNRGYIWHLYYIERSEEWLMCITDFNMISHDCCWSSGSCLLAYIDLSVSGPRVEDRILTDPSG